MYVMMSLFFCVDPCRNTVSFQCVQDGYMGIIGFHGMYFNACDCADDYECMHCNQYLACRD